MLNQATIIDRLGHVRAMVRRRLLAFGLCAVLAGGVAAFLTIVTLDWLLDLPSVLRMVGAIAFLSGFFVATWYWIVRPLGAELGLGMIAARLEEHFGDLQDRLSSAVDFVQHGASGSEALAREVVSRTELLLRQTPIESALSTRPLAGRAAALFLSVTVLTLIVAGNRAWVETGVYRYLYPFGAIEWPRRVAIQPVTGNLAVAVGESVTVRMKVVRGWHDALRGLVVLDEPDGSSVTLAMQRDADDTYYATVDAVTKDLKYWFEAGDDSTRRLAFTIRVVKRPEIVEAVARVRPPPYAAELSPTLLDLAEGPVRAPLGGEVEILIRASKTIPSDDAGELVGLRSQDGRFLPLSPDPTERTRLTCVFPVDGDLYFRIELRDAEGFENRGAAEFSILAVPDAAPRVTVLEPPALVDVTPTGRVPLRVRIDDDFGVIDAFLEIERVGAESPASVSLTSDLQRQTATRGITMSADHDWTLASYSLSPGDLLLYRAVAVDNCVTAEGAGQRGESAAMRLRIISEVEFDVRVRTELAQLETRVRQMLLEELEVLERTRSLKRNAAEAAALSADEREKAASLSAGQTRLVRRMKEVAVRMGKLAERMQHNSGGNDDGLRKVVALREAVERVATEPMTDAGAALSEARERTDAETQQEAIADAAVHEQHAVDAMRTVLSALSEWGSFQEMLTRSRELLDRQNAARTQTLKLGESMLGKPVESLPDAERAALRTVEREQEQLASDVGRLLDRMRELLDDSRQNDPAGADALDDALRAARAQDVERHLAEAVEGIRENRTAAAGVSQKNAAAAISRMVDALRERQTRELQELRKQLREAEDLLAQLLEDQRGLRAATHEAGLMNADESDFTALADDQRRISRNAALFAGDLARIEKALPAARIVEDAVEPMTEAAGYLRGRQAAPATASQDSAIALLEEALARLEETAAETEQELLRRSLGQIRENLEAVAEAQREVNEGVVSLQKEITDTRRLSRSEARVAANLARDQTDVRRLLEEHLGDFDKVVVYRWALDRVLTWMTQSRERLDRRDVDEALVALGSRIVGELEKLIGAIEQTEAMPLDMSFMEAERGEGGGQGAQMGGKLIPTVAELLVLKAMQVDITERTTQLDEVIDVETASEDQLRQLRALGEDQSEVKRLTEMVVNRAQEP